MTANDNSLPAGRRSGSQKRQRTRNISVPVDAAEFIVIDSRARAAGMSRGGYGRASMLGSAGPRAQRAPTVNAEALAHAVAALNRVGNNVNQIAKRLHSGGSAISANECFAALADVRAAVASILDIVGRKKRL
jgi:Bacterial mobilisation protein (MobC)